MSNRIADFRSMRGMSLDDLSEASGLAKSALSELERGITQPMLDSARRIARALDAYEHEIWPEDATMPLTTRTVDDEIAAAKARIAELEEALEPLADIVTAFDEKYYDHHQQLVLMEAGDARRAAALLKEHSQ